jgi:hypothetical protein
MSPSKLMDKLLESREKLVSKYKNIDKPLNFERQANSFVANVDVLKSIPTPEDIYEFLFQNQEDSKSENNEMYAQTGIQLDPAKKGTFKSAATRYGMSMDALATDAKENPEKYSGILRKKANFYRNFVKQTGGNTLYVDSKNDPRYKAYQDSLGLYEFTQLQKQLEKKENKNKDFFKPSSWEKLKGMDASLTKEGAIKQMILRNKAEQIINNSDNIKSGLYSTPKGLKKTDIEDYYNTGSYDIHSNKIKPKGNWFGLAPNNDYSNVNPKQQVIIKNPEIKKNYGKPYISNKKPTQPVKVIERNKFNNLNQIESIPYQEQEINYQYPDINYQAPENTEFYNPERVIGSEYIRNADGSMGRFQKKKSEYYDKELQEMNKQTGGKNVIHNGKPMYQRKDGKIVERGVWSNLYLSKKQVGGDETVTIKNPLRKYVG